MSLTVMIPGDPVAKGSMNAGLTADGRPYTYDQKSSRLRVWELSVKTGARVARKLVPPSAGPVRVTLVFYLHRPKSLPKKVAAPTKKPDLDKLARAVLDALTGIAWCDDAQVCSLNAVKVYAAEGMEGVYINVDEIEQESVDAVA